MSDQIKMRLISLDVFRGITITMMIIVNNPGAHWVHFCGLTLADLVFPFFLFIGGISVNISLQTRTDSKYMSHSVKRSVVLLLVGLFMWLQPKFDFKNLRLPGVLQRTAVVNIATFFVLRFARKYRTYIIIGILIGYYLLLKFVHVPGCDPSLWMTQSCSLAGYIDRKLLRGHLYKTDFDPEGILSTVPSIATSLMGTLAGDALKGLAKKQYGRAYRVLWCGLILVISGLLSHRYFPVYKPLWTSSYALLTSGLACIFLTLCWFITDFLKIVVWAQPLVWLGRNSLGVFVLSSIVAKNLGIIKIQGVSIQQAIYKTIERIIVEQQLSSVMYSIVYLFFWMGVAGVLKCRGVVIKI